MQAYIMENENALNVYRLMEAGFDIRGYAEPVTDTNGDLYEYVGQYYEDSMVIECNGSEVQLIDGFYYYVYIPLNEIVKGDIISALVQSITDTMEIVLDVNGFTLYIEGVPFSVIMQDPECKATAIKAGKPYLSLDYFIE